MATSAEHTRHSRKTSHPPRDAGQPRGGAHCGKLTLARGGAWTRSPATGRDGSSRLRGGLSPPPRPSPHREPGLSHLLGLCLPHMPPAEASHTVKSQDPLRGGDTTRKTGPGRTHVALSSSQLLPCTSSLVLPGVCAVEATRTAPHRAETEAPRRGHRSRDSSLGPAPAPESWPRPLPGQGERKGGRGQESLGPQTSTGPRPRPPHGRVSTGDRGIRRVSQQVTLTAVGLG